MRVETSRQDEVEAIGQRGLRLHVGAPLVEVVLVLVRPVDASIGIRTGREVVDPVGEVLPALGDAEAVLGLRHEQGRAVHEGDAVPEQPRVPGIAPVVVGLGEEPPLVEPGLEEVVDPVTRLPRAQAGQLDTGRAGSAVRAHQCAVVRKAPVRARLHAVAADVEVTRADPHARLLRDRCAESTDGLVGQAARGIPLGAHPGGVLGRVGIAPLRPREVLPGQLQAHVVPQQERGAERSLHDVPLTGGHRHRRTLAGERGLGEDVDDAVGGVRSVERGSGTEHDLHPVHVLLVGGDEVHEVHAERRHAGQPVVGEHVERAGEDVVEATDDHVGGLDPLADHVDARSGFQMIGERRRRTFGDLRGADVEGRGRGLGGLLGRSPRRGDDEGVELLGLGQEAHVVGGRLARDDGDVVEAAGPVPHHRDDQVVRSGAEVDAVAPLVVAQRPGRLPAAEHLDLCGRNRGTGFGVGDDARERSLLRRNGHGADERPSDQQETWCEPCRHNGLSKMRSDASTLVPTYRT